MYLFDPNYKGNASNVAIFKQAIVLRVNDIKTIYLATRMLTDIAQSCPINEI